LVTLFEVRRVRIKWKTVEDGSLINPFGERADGRPAIAAMYTKYFGSILRGSSTTFELATVRAIDADHALADSEQRIYAPDGNVVMTVHLAALFRRAGDGWQFVDGRPYMVAAMPS